MKLTSVQSLTDCRKLDAKRFSLCICVQDMEDVSATRGSFQHLQNHRKQICTGARSCLASFPSCSRRASNEGRTQRADFRRRDIRISQSLTDVSPCRPNLRPADRLQRGLAVSSLHTPCINATHSHRPKGAEPPTTNLHSASIVCFTRFSVTLL